MRNGVLNRPSGPLRFGVPLAACCVALFSSSTVWANLPSSNESTVAAPAVGIIDGLAAIEPPPLPPLGASEQFLPIPSPQITLVIRLSDRKVYVYEDEDLKASFPIAIGRSGWETPTGDHEVLQMIVDPAWENPFTGDVIPGGDIENPLGRRWIGFWTDGTNYIGFHGTPNEESVGTAASHGCIRMYNQDVMALFEMVDVGTRVTVMP